MHPIVIIRELSMDGVLEKGVVVVDVTQVPFIDFLVGTLRGLIEGLGDGLGVIVGHLGIKPILIHFPRSDVNVSSLDAATRS